MDAYKAIAPHPSTEWKRIAEAGKPFSINGRRVRIDIRTYFEDELNEILLIRACLPFKAWPFGGRVVIEGWRRTEAGVWTRLATEELEKKW